MVDNFGSSDRGIAADTLQQTSALPLHIMAAAIEVLPSQAAWMVDGRPFLSPVAADAYQRIVSTDFAKTSWCLDNEEDRKTVALWVGLGGSFIADFAASPHQPRIFAWVLSPDPTAAQFTLKDLKGRDGRWVPTSLYGSEDEFLKWLDLEGQPVNQAAVSSMLDCGPIGFRFRANNDALPSYFMLREFDGFRAQAILPGRSGDWSRWLVQFEALTGHRFAGITSANLSDLGREVRSGGTHKDLAEVQADMGYLGIPILSGPISMNGRMLPIEERPAGYKALNAPFAGMSEENRERSTEVAPLSTSLLGFTGDSCTWQLLRHGSIHRSVLAQSLEEHGIALEDCTSNRLELSRYVGDLVAAFPLFSRLESRQVAEISQLIEVLSFDEDEIIIREGDRAEKMFFIAKGSVVAETGDGVVLKAGNFFGEISLIEGIPRTATVRGHQAGILLALDTHIIFRLMEFLPDLADSIREMARQRLSYLREPDSEEPSSH